MAPRRTKITLALLTSTALVASTVGCGGSSSEPAGASTPTLTKAQVIARGSVICRAAEKRVDRLPAPRSDNPFAPGTPAAERRQAVRFLSGYADALESTRVGLRRLAAPRTNRELLDAYISGIGEAVARFRAAAADGTPRAMRLANEGFAIFDRVSAKTAAYGFPKGVCGSGEGG